MKNILAGFAALGAAYLSATQNSPIDLGVDATTGRFPQRWVMFFTQSDVGNLRADQPTLAVQQLVNGEWSGTPGRWYLGSLAGWDNYSEKSGDMIYIDMGQKWRAVGAAKAVAAAYEIIGPAKLAYYNKNFTDVFGSPRPRRR
jgi:hypothetical protein